MRELHERAAPILLRLAKSEWWPLNDAERTAVAAYFALVSMMWQLADRETMASTASERKYIMEKGVPPSNWIVCIGECKGQDWSEEIMYTGFQFDSGFENSKANCHQFVSTFGGMAFSTFSFPTAAFAGFSFAVSGILNEFALQKIWPLGGAVIGTPKRSLSDREMTKLGNLFYIN
ncbi:MAG: hypothetical protein J0H88_19185 [Sphingomonadales bacterium]|nr:hypothetical protein [Sphingomonadales bacterium]